MGLLMKGSFYKRLLKELSQKSRLKKFKLFQSLFRPRREDRILDVGADPQLFSRYTFEDYYPYPARIVGGGIRFAEVHSARQYYPQLLYAIFDGCALPFADKSFDIVFSNAVIEHVVGPGRQTEFAREIMRVGKSWFVTTPNYWFPLESHYHLAFLQFLPLHAQRTYNRLLGTSIPKGELLDLALLSARDLKRLFPTSCIVKMRVTFWPETLVAYHVDPARNR
jgi:SAM-dependent methyltransferase